MQAHSNSYYYGVALLITANMHQYCGQEVSACTLGDLPHKMKHEYMYEKIVPVEKLH